jgi:hypothetical protein
MNGRYTDFAVGVGVDVGVVVTGGTSPISVGVVGIVVAVVVGVGVTVGGLPAASKAPMSQPLPAGREAARWSMGGQAALSPASIAGLPAESSCVKVGPPLSASAPRSGSRPTRSLAVALAQLAASRLVPSESNCPLQAGPVPVWNRMLLRKRNWPSFATCTPVGLVDSSWLAVIVTNSASTVPPASIKMPPPCKPAVLPLRVAFRRVSSALMLMPPPLWPAWFALIVLRCTVVLLPSPSMNRPPPLPPA